MSKKRTGAVGHLVKGTLAFDGWLASYATIPTLADCLANGAVGCEIEFLSLPLVQHRNLRMRKQISSWESWVCGVSHPLRPFKEKSGPNKESEMARTRSCISLFHLPFLNPPPHPLTLFRRAKGLPNYQVHENHLASTRT